MNDLLTPIFGENFEVTLNYPLWITSNPYKLKEETKRGLLEIVDTYDKLSLAYSGGSDSGFILCCIHDLIEEGKLKKDTIEIFQGIFIADNRTQADANRATRFANSLGFDPKKIELNLDNTPHIHNAIMRQTFKNIEKCGGLVEERDILYACGIQDYACSLQDSVVIRGRASMSLWGYKTDNRKTYEISTSPWNLMPNQLKHYDPDFNEVEVFLWDNKIFSCFISPYKLKRQPIDPEPFLNVFDQPPPGPANTRHFNKYMDKWMIYLQCYPQMQMILYKFQSLPYKIKGIARNRIKEFENFIASYETKKDDVKLPSGEYFTQKHLTNYKDYFET